MENSERSWRNDILDVKPCSPFFKNSRKKRIPSTGRLYRAPQSTVREDKASTRRRRNHHRASMSRKHRCTDDHHSNSDSSSMIESLEAPCLWLPDEGNDNHSPSEQNHYSWTPSTTSRKERNYRRRKHHYADTSVRSDIFADEESVATHYTHQSQMSYPKRKGDDDARSLRSSRRGKNRSHARRVLRRVWNHTDRNMILFQLAVVITLMWIVYNARAKVISHQQRVQLYDEERAHILEQMTWIDNAAKKVHKKYSGYDSMSFDELHKPETAELRTRLDQLQHRIQQNARHRIGVQYGDAPVQISLAIPHGTDHLSIAVTDDAPHAVSTLLQQLDAGVWDVTEFQRLGSHLLQASTVNTETLPILEFVEISRGCRSRGSVVLRQLESDEFHVLVLKIHMENNIEMHEGDVCIGSVVIGMERLAEILPELPLIQSSDDS